jgi:hypothetical protein
MGRAAAGGDAAGQAGGCGVVHKADRGEGGQAQGEEAGADVCVIV